MGKIINRKLMLAIEAEDYTSIGQDLVAMCVNDLICCGARPLFFLDYFATSKLELGKKPPNRASNRRFARLKQAFTSFVTNS